MPKVSHQGAENLERGALEETSQAMKVQHLQEEDLVPQLQKETARQDEESPSAMGSRCSRSGTCARATRRTTCRSSRMHASTTPSGRWCGARGLLLRLDRGCSGRLRRR